MRSAGGEFTIKQSDIEKVPIITYQMGCSSIQCTQKKNRIVGIDGIMSEVNESNLNRLGQKKQFGDKRLYQ